MMLNFENYISELHEISLRSWTGIDSDITLLREDQIHPIVSGNKYRKLKYAVLVARKQGHDTLLTFGGAYSNHLVAVAAMGKPLGFNTIGVVRGDELAEAHHWNTTLKMAAAHGMQLKFVSRATYNNKTNPDFLTELESTLGPFYHIPEGGSSKLGVQGCSEILAAHTQNFDLITVAVGTGGTLAGLSRAASPTQRILGFSALNGCFQVSEIEKYTSKKNYELTDDYCFGGYAKIDAALVRFINEFKAQTSIALDPVYTAKMMWGIVELFKSGTFRKNTRILAIHTGGLQGIAGMNELLKKKNLPQIL